VADGDERSPGAPIPTLALSVAGPTHVVGSLVGWDDEHGPLVTYPGHDGEPLVAMTIVPLDGPSTHAASALGQRVVLAFDGGRADAPIILGLLHTPGLGPLHTPGLGLLRTPGLGPLRTPGLGPLRTPGLGPLRTPGLGLLRTPGLGLLHTPGATPATAEVDGSRVVIEAADEIVLCCGDASITLRRNGRVVIRGTAVETRAKGVNRIRGGSVQIN